MDPNNNSSNPQNPNSGAPLDQNQPVAPLEPSFPANSTAPSTPTAPTEPSPVYPTYQATPTPQPTVASEPVPTWPLPPTTPPAQSPTPSSFDPSFGSNFSAQAPQPSPEVPSQPVTESYPPQVPVPPAGPSEAIPNYNVPAPEQYASVATPTTFGAQLQSEPTPNPASQPQPANMTFPGSDTVGQTPSWVMPTPPVGETPVAQAATEAGITQPETMPFSSTAETAPTDLSHLVDTANPPTAQTSVAPESLVVPGAVPSETASVVSGGHSDGFPKWILVVIGVVMLLVVIGASAYFILGIGQPAAPTTSLPAVQQSALTNPKALPATPTPVPTLPGPGNGLGGLPVSSSSSSVTVPASPSGTTAIDIIKQRQGTQ